MVRHPIRIQFVVTGIAEDTQSRDLLNRAYYSIQAFAPRRDSVAEIAIGGDELNIACVISAETFDAAANLVSQAFSAAQRRDPILNGVALRVNRTRV